MNYFRKRLHKRFLSDVVGDISQSAAWRRAIFSLKPGQYLTIDNQSEIPLPKYLQPLFNRHRLSYRVCVPRQHASQEATDLIQDIRDLGIPSSPVVFEFSASEYPGLKQISVNNADYIGDEPPHSH